MHIGEVTREGDVTIRLTVRGAGGSEQDISAILDTGFNGFLALPPRLVEALGLESLETRVPVVLASGEERLLETYEATALLDATPHVIVVVEAAEPLLGTALLWDHELHIECWERGRVQIQPRAA